ncbi:hypothetical protein DAEQUDRAFT_462178 [Daedalea quercina L-15889]|uniref:Transmembrane protein n=1 Tax=Daedalea quercina L-15889 TaxID=1314783 RepID=A0A165TDG9_9APHY|nr:hypothetical protein DAEQUDRAFT_462178 [Daedalea quercina L-15889]
MIIQHDLYITPWCSSASGLQYSARSFKLKSQQSQLVLESIPRADDHATIFHFSPMSVCDIRSPRVSNTGVPSGTATAVYDVFYHALANCPFVCLSFALRVALTCMAIVFALALLPFMFLSSVVEWAGVIWTEPLFRQPPPLGLEAEPEFTDDEDSRDSDSTLSRGGTSLFASSNFRSHRSQEAGPYPYHLSEPSMIFDYDISRHPWSSVDRNSAFGWPGYAATEPDAAATFMTSSWSAPCSLSRGGYSSSASSYYVYRSSGEERSVSRESETRGECVRADDGKHRLGGLRKLGKKIRRRVGSRRRDADRMDS